MAEMAKAGLTMEIKNVHLILGEGDFVLGQSGGSFAGRDVTFYDLFRIENGKITEHWDVIEPLLPKDQWKNSNGKF
jgi:predicted SnoaL-like aldol condensation-catalyzing enzyme